MLLVRVVVVVVVVVVLLSSRPRIIFRSKLFFWFLIFSFLCIQYGHEL